MNKILFSLCGFSLSLQLLHAQNVGIGDSFPSARLSILGKDTSLDGLAAGIKIKNASSANAWYIRTGAAGTNTPADGFSISDNTGYYVNISSVGNVGLGMAPSNGRLHVNGDIRIEGLSLFEFGANVSGKEINAGKVGYNAFGQNALTFVGAGTNVSNRAVYFYAEGGSTFNGIINSMKGYKIYDRNALFMGSFSSYNGTSFYSNLFVGDSSGTLITSGYANTFAGGAAGYNNTSGYRNTYIGTLSGFRNQTYYDNTFIGAYAGYSNASYQNTFLGSGAGFFNQSGANNIFIGVNSAQNNSSGINNTIVGNLSGYNSNGNENVFLGINSGFTNSTGNQHTLIGSYADVGSGSLMNASAIGYRSFVNQNNSLVLGSINGVNGATSDTRVGIGIPNPGTTLDIKTTDNNIIRLNGGNQSNISFYENNIYRGYFGSFAGNPEDMDFGTGSGNTTGKLHLTIQAIPKFTIDASGNVGIGTISPAAKLDIQGNTNLNGELNRPSTGTANLVPIAYGNIAAAGTINSGSGNFTLSKISTGWYAITITGETYNFQTYTTVVTPVYVTTPVICGTSSGGGNLYIYTFNNTGAATDNQFQFVVYKQ